MADYDHVDGVRIDHTQICPRCGKEVAFKDKQVTATMCYCGNEVLNANYTPKR